MNRSSDSGPAAGGPLNLRMRPIKTPINILVAGASHTGKSSFVRAACSHLGSVAAHETAPDQPFNKNDPRLSESDDSIMTLTEMMPITVPEACREVIYSFLDCPGHGSTLDQAEYLRALMGLLIGKQADDYRLLDGCRGLSKSLACGSLQHSITALIYFLRPHGPSQLDTVLLAALSRHVAVVPVVGLADSLTDEEATASKTRVQAALAAELLDWEQHQDLAASDEPFRFSEAADPAGQLLPLLISTRAAGGSGALPSSSATPAASGAGAAGLSQLLDLLTGNEVYGLLDHAWGLFGSFCDAYTTTCGDLVSAACAPFSKLIAGPAALAASLADRQRLRLQMEEDRRRSSTAQLNLERQLTEERGLVQSALDEEKALLEELVKVIKV